MKKILFLFCLALFISTTASAQRRTDKLDRGLVAVPASSGNFISWKIFAEEYYDVTYNIYRNGTKLNSTPLKVSCYTDAAGTATSKYQVAAVVRGVEQEKCAEVIRWANGYFDIPVADVVDRNGNTVTSEYIINDVSLGDVDGDGITEFIIKRNYTGDILSSSNKTKFHHLECYNLKGERLWWIDCGPNLMAGPDEQWDIVAYDWDEDGKAECIMRGADNMYFHTASGKTIAIGNMNYYAPRDEYTREGAEYLLYINGETGEPYGWDGSSDKFTPMAYPLPRFESGESDYETVWGKNDTGHRATKHYFGAPFLDGRRASIFLGRGCYTRHKMCALDVDPTTHELTQRWRWNEYNSSSPWFGNGFHNFAIGDVDWDGRDEIIFGSMIIDDNGKGLCTTGLGHGDAQHCADLDPYRHGNEQFTCNETRPACTYYNATTGKIYYRLQSGSDDGRALCANFSNEFPGSLGRTTQTGLVSTVADKVIEGGPSTEGTNDALFWSHLNQRIYWDGDLCDEVFDSPGSEARAGAVYKPGGGRLFNCEGSNTNNSSKNNPGAIADIFGDWREEIVMRAEGDTKLRIYTTNISTSYRIYTLWHDHQYRNAMVWQSVGYNQPPHKSYFLGQMEGITTPPPPLTMSGRVEIANGGTIGTTHADQHVIVCETNNTNVSIEEGASPYIVTFNVPSWIQGTNSNILNGTAKVNSEYYTCTVSGGAFTGDTRVIKQGDGILTLPNVVQKHTGETNIWAGTLNFDGTLESSPLWLNRFAELNSNGGKFLGGIKMDYDSKLRPGGAENKGNITTTTLKLGFGSRIIFDIYEDVTADQINASSLSIETKNWKYGPQYLTPVFEFIVHSSDGTTAAEGRYLLGNIESITGTLDNIKIEGLGTTRRHVLVYEDGKLYLDISGVRDASTIIWNGNTSSIWDFAAAENFTLESDPTATNSTFVNGDKVIFDDSGEKLSISLTGDLEADSVIVNSSKNYSFAGSGSLIGTTTLVKQGTGTLTIGNDNTYTGGTRISGGTLKVSSLSNANQAKGNLGAVNTAATKFIIENGATLQTTAAVTQGSPIQFLGDEGGVINNSADFVMNKSMSGTLLTKKGSGWLKQQANSSLKKMIITAGAVQTYNGNPATTVEIQGGALYDESQATSHAIVVPKGKTGTWHLTNTYYTAYANTLTGEGTLIINPRNTVSRVRITGNWSNFQGTIKHTNTSIWLPLDASTGLAKGTLEIAENCGVTNVAKTFTIGKLTGKGSLNHPVANFQNKNAVNGSNTWRVGNSSDALGDFTFEGTISDGGGTNKANFEKIGTCKMTVKGAWTNSGTVKVSAGRLQLAQNASLGTGTLTVAKDAIFAGVTSTTGNLTNSSVTVNGKVIVGVLDTSTSGVINFGGKNVTFNNGSTLVLNMRRSATASVTGGTSIQNIGTLTMNGTVEVNVSSSFSAEVGDSVILWKADKVLGTPVLASAVIDVEKGLFWDDTDIAKGILRVTNVAPVGIANVYGNDENAPIYTISGLRVFTTNPNLLQPGIYIRNGRKFIVR